MKRGTAGKRQEESLGAVVGCAGKQEGADMDRQQFPVQFLSSLLCKAILAPGKVAEWAAQAQKGT